MSILFQYWLLRFNDQLPFTIIFGRAKNTVRHHIANKREKVLFIHKQKRHFASKSKVRERKRKFCLLNEAGSNYLLTREENKRNFVPKVSLAPLSDQEGSTFFWLKN